MPNSPELQFPQLSVDRARRSILHGARLESRSVRGKTTRGSEDQRHWSVRGESWCLPGCCLCVRTDRFPVDESLGTLRRVAVMCGARHGPQDPDRVGSLSELELPGRPILHHRPAQHHLVRPGPYCPDRSLRTRFAQFLLLVTRHLILIIRNLISFII